MCRFLVFTLPPEAELSALQPVFASFGRRRLGFVPLENASLASQLPDGTSLGSLTHEQCDCGTALGSGVPEPFQVDPVKLAKVRRKGWSEAKIERWSRDQTMARRKAAAADLRAHDEELRSWCNLIESCLASGATPSFGVLSHWFDGTLRDEAFEIERRVLRRSELTAELLYQLEDDCLYEFQA